MPNIYYLNPPPNPFWDFVSGLENHPRFTFRGQPFEGPANQQTEQPSAAHAEQPQMSDNTKGKQPEPEDPPEVTPENLNQENENRRGGMPFRGRGRFAAAVGDDDQSRRGPGCRGRGGPGFRGRGGHHHGPPPPWGFHRGAWWAGHGPGPHRHPGHPHGPPHQGPDGEGFNVGEFLNTLGSRLGIDLTGAAEGMGLGRFTSPRNADADFEPRADVFDTPDSYIVHLSLPGAKKEDVGVDWDGENSHLRIAGVVHRPGADEQLLSQLVVDGRKRETGVFEKIIRLGTRRDPASIDIAGISAKMTDGVLHVKVPKVEVEYKKRDVPISASTPSPARDTEKTTNEKVDLLDHDEDMYEAAPTTTTGNQAVKEKEAEKERDTRSETMDYEKPEQLPQYEVEEAHEDEDWEKAGSEEEGEYVKINVD